VRLGSQELQHAGCRFNHAIKLRWQKLISTETFGHPICNQMSWRLLAFDITLARGLSLYCVPLPQRNRTKPPRRAIQRKRESILESPSMSKRGFSTTPLAQIALWKQRNLTLETSLILRQISQAISQSISATNVSTVHVLEIVI
jgi:hypothetical protein